MCEIEPVVIKLNTLLHSGQFNKFQFIIDCSFLNAVIVFKNIALQREMIVLQVVAAIILGPHYLATIDKMFDVGPNANPYVLLIKKRGLQKY